ncbi:hypothetical protein A9P82_00160 [Arachidicoccus ginsenosidimutans]|uniref:hypothetical protein n=1 Tax=Arachidicoccus sp. BS20 TaxID=1850526 RepID=UPI0007F10DF8|nr:hypothetical protein [Arachidicoccus sp. BS20]ANI87871.1 hypothetical protein A9P82_00160 [Arachidicoccus sp. BS20]
MKKLFLAFFVLMTAAIGTKVSAQATYKTAGGLFIDAGDGTAVGPSIKHFVTGKDAIQGLLLFGSGFTSIGAEYSYNQRIRNAGGLLWNIGVGPQVSFGHGFTDFAVRPQIGLEYKIHDVPLGFGFDWRPSWRVTHGSYFDGGRFGIAFRYVFH